MPELPEVETLKRELSKVLVGKTIRKATVRVAKMVTPLSIKNFQKNVTGEKIITVARRAKVIIITLGSGDHVVIHLKMTGQLIFKPKLGKTVFGGHPQPGGLDNLPNKFTHIVFYFTDESILYFNDMRRFGWVKHIKSHEHAEMFAKTGVEPLSKNFTYETFDKLLGRYLKRNLKQFLLDQTLIAGLGNIYVDEACFLAKVLPTRNIESLTITEKQKLYKSIIEVLKASIQKKGTSAHNYVRTDGTKGGFVPFLNVYGQAKLPCKVCGTLISKIKFAGRGTHFCLNCQK